jgi:hypothetical protein
VVEHIDSSGTDYVQIRVDESSPNGSDMTDTATSPEIVSWTVSNATVRQAAGFYVRRFGTQVVPTRQLAPAADKSAKFTWQADGTVALASVTSGGGGGATTLAGLTDTTITAPGAGDFLRYNGSTWLNTTLVAGDIPSLDAAKITTGTFATARIPDLDAAKITTGTFDIGRIPVASIDHDSLLNFVANEHVDHSAVAITGSSGLTGGGDLTASSSITVKYTSGSNLIDSAADNGDVVAADYILYQDLDTGDVRKDTVGALPFTNNIGTITRVNITAGNGLSGTSVDTTTGDHTQTLAVGQGTGIAVNIGDVALDINNLTDVSGETVPDNVLLGGDQLVLSRGAALFKTVANTIPLSAFNDTGYLTSVAAGTGITVSGAGNDTVNIDYSAGTNLITQAQQRSPVAADNTDWLVVTSSDETLQMRKIQVLDLPFTDATVNESITGNWSFNADTTIGDDDALQFGTTADYWFKYNTTGTQFEFWTTDSNGAGLDALLMSVSDGGTVVDFNGQVITPAIRVGGGPHASVGEVKLSYTDAIAWRNATDTADVVGFTVDSTDNLVVTPTDLRPDTDGGTDLGTTAIRYGHVYTDNITVTNGLVTSVSEGTDGGITVNPTAGAVIINLRLTGTDNYILEAPDLRGTGISTSASIAYIRMQATMSNTGTCLTYHSPRLPTHIPLPTSLRGRLARVTMYSQMS